MAITERLPLMKPGAMRRNVAVGLLYFFLSPLLLVLFPFYLLFAIGTNRNGLGDAVAESPLRVIPGVSSGGWQAAVVVFVGVLLVFGLVGAGTPSADDPDNDTTVEPVGNGDDPAADADSDVDGDDTPDGDTSDDTGDDAESDQSEDTTAEVDSSSGDSDGAGESEDDAPESNGEESETDDDSGDAADDGPDPTDDPSTVADSLVVAELQVEDVTADEEHIVLENLGDEPLDLSGWTIRDREDGGQVARGLDPFRFPDGFVLEPDSYVIVWTGEGEATDTDLYWGYNLNMWNDDGDVVILRTPSGERVIEHAYGNAEAPSDGDEDSNEGDGSDDRDDADDGNDGGDDEGDTGETPDGELEIHHLDVGQADSTLFVTPNGETILIDTGDWTQDGSEVISYLEDLGIDSIDHLVATHGHADHIGGHAGVIEHFEEHGNGIGAAYDSGVAHTSGTYDNYLDAIEEYDVDLFVVEEGDELPLDDESVTAEVLNPPAGDSGDDVDYNSIALAVEFGEFRYLTTGDAAEGAEQRMASAHGDALDADVYQAGHHGSSTSSTAPFLDAVAPEIAVISSDYDSQYGHPHDEVLNAFAAAGIETYWTGVHGNIVVTTDGETVSVDPSQEFSTDPEDLRDEKPDDESASIRAMPGAIDVTAPALVG